MRTVAVGVTVSVFMVWALGRAADYELATAGPPVRIGDGSLIDRIAKNRVRTWRCEGRLGQARSATSYSAERSPSLEYRKWVHRLWAKRAAYRCNLARQLSSPVAAIRAVFGPYAAEALRVSWCESRWHVGARNGQYLGLFQMGDYARSTYGHGWTPLQQARAAYRYFRAAGGWSPWACKP